MFVGEDDEWRDENGLFAVQKCPIDGVHRHLCFAESDVSGEESIHGLTRFHIREYFLDRRLLIGRVHIWEAFFEKTFLFQKWEERKAVSDATIGIDIEEFPGYPFHILGGTLQCFSPFVA